MVESSPRLSPQLTAYQLPSWISFSVAIHLVVLSLWGSDGLVRLLNSPPSLIVDIAYIATDHGEETTLHQTAQLNSAQIDLANLNDYAERHATQVHTLPAPKSQTNASSAARSETYFGIDQVDVPAKPINDVMLHYPSVAYIQRISGVVQFKLYINEEGQLEKIDMIDARPPRVFEQAAWNAVKQLQFSPALKAGRPVKSEKTIDVVFDPYLEIPQPARQPAPSVAER
jgi:TonB family protein